ncbi:hypothetical protein DO021_12110 [Desulfobacter hydrogenophilus]|uniref:Uncharacterized protein n=1 Tax=Desulfobacter hydrogenophilus TaxID=2291 RepID=A0A328FF91_9BACT|nr:hypothetical protein [Desulfobacter hydrogenophilus]NDY72408.1 hypothetical protein [Desulfobacter hydrogenophilus]QBH13732.1 hypothetical protein EYB58_12860 [Desulfobacter hydrogenophilus]RAM01677.1 hypothetical protein DO021_12110 [Desulfobacter hydrogenophilus]
MQKLKPIQIFLFSCVVVVFLNQLIGIAHAVTPSQVLVLYNADWKVDDPLTDPGQDSKEIADHYISMHTDPKTGEKPYVLGLSCSNTPKHLKGSSLNEHHLSERSHDNASGVVLKKNEKILKFAKDDMRDSRLLEFTLPQKKGTKWLLDSLKIQLKKDLKNVVLLVDNGKSQHGNRVKVQTDGPWNVRANARIFLTGSFSAHASCKEASGELHKWETKYTDFQDVEFSETGPDGKRDDRMYLLYIENQVKKFLEAPENARADGTLLKDHILFMVVCYGLPRTVVAPYGIARGITEHINNYGSIISLEQRLQLMYYDLEAIMGSRPQPLRFRDNIPFTAYYFRTPQAKPLFGIKANPFMHPLVYGKKKNTLDKLQPPVPFISKERNRFKNRQLFFVMRIDAPTPMAARGLIDRAVYASRYGGLAMGEMDRMANKKTKDRVGRIEWTSAGQWLWEKGIHHLYYGGAARDRLAFLRFSPTKGFFNRGPVYLPGGIAGTVISHNGWKKGEMIRDIAMGVTVTTGAARVYNGAPHIHNKSWWDDEILYPFLLKGNSVGEVLLMNQAHLGWITTFVGDPLYHWPLSGSKDTTIPEFKQNKDIEIVTLTGINKTQEVWLRVKLHSSSASPETAQFKATSSGGKVALCESFEGAPYVLLGNKKEVFNQKWKLKVKDPYGNNYVTNIDLP